MLALKAQTDVRWTADQEVLVLIPTWQYSLMEIDHEIFSAVILTLLLIQEEQLSVSGERMCTSTG